jgi:hypothetical protein
MSTEALGKVKEVADNNALLDALGKFVGPMVNPKGPQNHTVHVIGPGGVVTDHECIVREDADGVIHRVIPGVTPN